MAAAPTMSTADIREHMDVFGSCGNKLGKVDHVEGSQIKLTKNDSPDGMHHLIPMSWVKQVDEHVHLSKTSARPRGNGSRRNLKRIATDRPRAGGVTGPALDRCRLRLRERFSVMNITFR